MMSPQDWHDMASVYRAGAAKAREFTFNHGLVHQAIVLDAQADRCEEIAEERTPDAYGFPKHKPSGGPRHPVRGSDEFPG